MKIVYVNKSSVHGYGLFAKKRIRKGEVIGRVNGRLSRSEGKYVLWIHDKYGIEVEGMLKYINHSDHPNAEYSDDLVVRAIKNIAKNEELTHNYNGE